MIFPRLRRHRYPPVPGSSPIKALKGVKPLESVKARPFTPLDLNIVGSRAKAFQDAREKAGATPPPSSPPASSVFHSSPVAPTRQQALGLSPIKQQRPFCSLDNSCAQHHSRTEPDQASTLQLHLVPNSELPNFQPLDWSRTQSASRMPTRCPICCLAARASAWSLADPSLLVSHTLPVHRPQPISLPLCKASDATRSYASICPTRLVTSRVFTPSSNGSPLSRVLPRTRRQVSRASPPKASPIAASIATQTGTSSNGTFIVRIVGQNGLIVDGKRRREGQVLRLTSGKSLIDFFGVKCRFQHIPSSADLQPSPVQSMQGARCRVVAARHVACQRSDRLSRSCRPTKRRSPPARLLPALHLACSA